MAGFDAAEHVRRRTDYQRIYDRGAKAHGKFLTLFTLPNDLQIGRLGIAATRKMGGAVVRNRAKRLIREVFRRNKLAPGYDVVVIPRRELVDAGLTAIEAEFRSTLERSLRRRKLPDAC
jgi:ribonuclease P protein component